MALTRVGKGALDKGVIKDQTNLGTQAADTDEYLLYDASTDSLKSIAASNVTPNETLITGKDALGEGAASGDQILIYDVSAGVLKKVTQSNFLNFPTVSSVSPTNVTSGDGTGNYTFVITGGGFIGATASLINSSGTSVSFDSQTVDSDTQITGTIAKSSLPGSGEPYDVRVTAGSGLQSTIENQINIDQQPVFSTAAGSLGTTADADRASFSAITIFASDPESGGDVTYTLESGSLPSGLSGSSTSSGYVISGTPNAVASATTSTFTIRAKDVNSNTSDREFSITIQAPIFQVFTSSGTFSVPSGVSTVDVLVVAGGGGGGNCGANYSGGGGGAGGLVYRPGFPVTPGGTVTVTVGCGGSAGDAIYNTPESGGNGQDSVFGTLTAKGGGGGAATAGSPCAPGNSGGSGGGAAGRNSASGGSATQPTQPGDSGTYGFGNAGGNSAPCNEGGRNAGGGGGGAGGTGQPGSRPGSDNVGGDGGVGKAYSIADGTTSVYYAGGGGGAASYSPESPGQDSGTGGQGGGGNAGRGSTGSTGQLNQASQAGTTNRGGGGGGGGYDNQSPGDAPVGHQGAAGGKGVVIVRWS